MSKLSDRCEQRKQEALDAQNKHNALLEEQKKIRKSKTSIKS